MTSAIPAPGCALRTPSRVTAAARSSAVNIPAFAAAAELAAAAEDGDAAAAAAMAAAAASPCPASWVASAVSPMLASFSKLAWKLADSLFALVSCAV